MRNNVSLAMLRLFLRVASTRSFTETARMEHVSQPALSRTIRLLEDQLGVRLFDRDTRNVELTSAGLQLEAVANSLISDYDLAFGDLSQAFAGQRGRVAIGALPSVAATMLPPVLAQFQAERPQVQVQLHDGLLQPLLRMLEDHRIDFAVTIEPEKSDRLTFEPLFTDQCVFVCRRGDPLDGTKPLPWRAFQDRPFVAMSPESSVRRMTDAAFLSAGVNLRQLYECAHLASVGGLVQAGLGVTVLPVSTLPLLIGFDLSSRPLTDPIMARSIGVVTLAGRTPSPAATPLIELLQAACRRQTQIPAALALYP